MHLVALRWELEKGSGWGIELADSEAFMRVTYEPAPEQTEWRLYEVASGGSDAKPSDRRGPPRGWRLD